MEDLRSMRIKGVLWFSFGVAFAILLGGVAVLLGFRPTQAGVVTPQPTPLATMTLPAATSTPTPPASATPGAYSLLWEREGGAGGACERLVLGADSAASFGPCAEPMRGQLSADEFQTYLIYIARYMPFDYTAAANGAVHLRMIGRGNRAPTTAEQAEIAAWAERIHTRLLRERQQGVSVALARQDLAARLGLALEAVRDVAVEPVTWPDACLGLPVTGATCVQAPTAGFRIQLEANGVRYEYRSDLRGVVRAASNVAANTPVATATTAPGGVTPTSVPAATNTPQPAATATPRPTAIPTMPLPTGAWRVEYWGNATLSGLPIVTGTTNDVDYDWGYGSPAAGVPTDRFSARWAKRVRFSEGDYNFIVRTDDGARLWVDGSLVIDRWVGGAGENRVKRHISRGDHNIVFEYFELEGIAKARLTWEKFYDPKETTPTLEPWITEWRGAYYANRDLSGQPFLVRNDTQIAFDWGSGAPVAGVPADRFSVRWNRRLQLAEGPYRFHVRADDGVRVWVDGRLLIDQWAEGIWEKDAHLYLASGLHDLRVEYFEASGVAQARLDWARLESFQGWKGEYYPNRDLAGKPMFVRDDPAPVFDWSQGEPGIGVPKDNFSVRWTRTQVFQGGRYRLTVHGDDGVRLYLDGQLLLDRWSNAAGQRQEREVTLAAGNHTVIVEYQEREGYAWVTAGWQLLAADTPVAPTATRTPAPPTATATRTALPPTPTRTPTQRPTLGAPPTQTPAPATATVVPATATATLLPPTATPTTVPATATAMPVPPTATATALPPTATATATNTPLPPTATATVAPPTVAPPTSTATALPPTATPTLLPTIVWTLVPPTATPTAVSPTRTLTPTLVPDLIIDNADPRFSTLAARDAWTLYTDPNGQHYNGSHVYNRQIGAGQDMATWTFTVTVPGAYEVYAWWWSEDYRPTDAPYTVHHLQGATTVLVNQRFDGGKWNLLGTFSFGGPGSVTLSDKATTGRDLAADAIRVVYKGPLVTATPTSPFKGPLPTRRATPRNRLGGPTE